MKLRSVMSILLAVLTLCSVSLVYAESNTIADSASVSSKELVDYARTMEKYLVRNMDGTVSINVPQNIIKAKYHNSVIENVEITNSLIKNGYLKLDSKCNVTVTEKYVNYTKKQILARQNLDATKESICNVAVYAEGNTLYVEENKISGVMATKNAGINKFVYRVASCEMWIDDYNTGLLAQGIISSTVLYMIPPVPLVRQYIIAYLTTMNIVITNANYAHRGVIIYGILIPGPFVAWVSSQ